MDRSLQAQQHFRYLYAVAEGLPAWWQPPSEGVDAAVVIRRALGDLTLVTSPLAAVPRPRRRDEDRHHDVVASLLDARAIVPFPFATVVPEAQLEAWLAARLPAIRASLRDLSGYVEMTVRLLRLDLRDDGQARREGVGRLRALADRLVEHAGLPHWRYRASGREDGTAASVAFLVPRGDLATFLAHIAPVASRAEGLAVVPTGPSAPYSFAPSLEDDRLTARAV
jgi:hypothetical protein